MSSHRLNPFRYGKPIPPQHFVGRREALGTLFSRLRNGDSTAIVGGPHIGKSSLLRYVTEPQVQTEWLHDLEQHVFIDIDCQSFPEQYKQADFWALVLSHIEQAFPEPKVKSQLEMARQNPAQSHLLESLFRHLGRSGRRVVLLIDEFDVLLHHPSFNRAEFFGLLRSLASRTDSLTLITASRLSVAEMNARSHEINPLGSPFFNTVIEVPLLPLSDAEVGELLERSLADTVLKFSLGDHEYVRRMAGRHPFLVQVCAAALFDAGIQTAEPDKYRAAGEILYQRIAAHFDDMWRHLSPKAQTALVILALAELKGQVDKRDFDTSDLGKLDFYGPELRNLATSGLVEKESDSGWHADWGNFVIWHGSRWRLSAGGLVYWVADNIVSGSRKTIPFDKWLAEREFDGVLTQGEKGKLKDLAGKIPPSVVARVADFMGVICKRLFLSPQ